MTFDRGRFRATNNNGNGKHKRSGRASRAHVIEGHPGQRLPQASCLRAASLRAATGAAIAARDPGNRLTDEAITLQPGLIGETQRHFEYDELNRMTEAQNNYARVFRTYDNLSRLSAEQQYIRLDGTGFANNWQFPITLGANFDKQSNRTNMQIVGSGYFTVHGFDALNRTSSIDAAYFGIASHNVATYAYFGPGRVQKKTLGNGAYLSVGYDAKRRTGNWNWTDSLGGPLVSLGYGFDDVDNPLHETFGHDLGLSDNYGYNARYEVTGVNYRNAGATDYRTFGGGYATTFAYDDNLNRQSANSNDPFANDPFVADAYTVNAANEYQTISRNSVFMNPVHDAAGNMTALPTRPARGASAGLDVFTTLAYDAFNRPITVTAGANAEQVYLYDALGRRICAMELPVPYTSSTGATAISKGRRYIYDGWSVATERVFNLGATLANAPSTLERVYVEGPQLDEHILCAIDGDGGGLATNLNEPVSASGPNTNDYRYYYLPNRLGNTMALLDELNHRRTLEYYRYTVYGEATVLPVVDTSPMDGLEDTPLDLTDNNADMLTARGPGNPGSLDPTAGRVSQMNNQYTLTGRYLDTSTGLHYFRYRYYESRSGRFITRDPVATPWSNLYSYCFNCSTYLLDLLGLDSVWRVRGAEENDAKPVESVKEGAKDVKTGKEKDAPKVTVDDKRGASPQEITDAISSTKKEDVFVFIGHGGKDEKTKKVVTLVGRVGGIGDAVKGAIIGTLLGGVAGGLAGGAIGIVHKNEDIKVEDFDAAAKKAEGVVLILGCKGCDLESKFSSASCFVCYPEDVSWNKATQDAQSINEVLAGIPAGTCKSWTQIINEATQKTWDRITKDGGKKRAWQGKDAVDMKPNKKCADVKVCK